MKKLVVPTLFINLLCFCHQSKEQKLPILGETSIDENTGELVYYTAPDFLFEDQLNKTISEVDIEGKINVVDFFFTTCPTICPQMTNHLVKVQEYFLEEERVGLISYSIDPKHDTPQRLSQYAKMYGINSSKWSLLTSKQTDVFEIAKDYKVMAFDDTDHSQDGLIHDGTFVLLDEKRRIRGYYNGLDENDVDRLVGDIKILLNEFNS